MLDLVHHWTQQITIEKQMQFTTWYVSSRAQDSAEVDTPTIAVWDGENISPWLRVDTWAQTPIAFKM